MLMAPVGHRSNQAEGKQNFQQWLPNEANKKMFKGEKIAPGGFTIYTYDSSAEGGPVCIFMCTA